MTKQDIDNIIRILCPYDEDYQKPCISPAYLKEELEALALEPTEKSVPMSVIENIKAEIRKCNVADFIAVQSVLEIMDKHISGKETDETDCIGGVK